MGVMAGIAGLGSRGRYRPAHPLPAILDLADSKSRRGNRSPQQITIDLRAIQIVLTSFEVDTKKSREFTDRFGWDGDRIDWPAYRFDFVGND
jgi:hypothetical protein